MYRILAFVIGVISLTGCATGQGLSRGEAVVRAELIELGPDPGIITGAANPIYRLGRYNVRGVCSGRFRRGEVIVAHYNGLEKEVTTLSPGDNLVLLLRQSPEFVRSQGFGMDSPPKGTSPAMMAALAGPGVHLVAVVASKTQRASCN